MKSEIYTTKVDPDTAERWLGLNRKNRNLNPTVVDRYARDMLDGAWQFTGEAIKFDDEGNLLDGQYRLAAIVKSGCTIETLVVDGIKTSAQDVMDSGRIRTAADALRMRGEPNSNHVAAIAAMGLGNFTTSGSLNQNKVTHTSVIQWVEENPDVQQAILIARANPLPGVPVSPWAFALMALRRIDEEEAVRFASDLSQHRTNGPGDPRAALLNRLTNAAISREKLSRADLLMLLFRTWNAVREGKSISKLSVVGRDGQPIPIPVPR